MRASVAHAKRRGDALFELKLDTAALTEKVDARAFAVLAYFTLHPLWKDRGSGCASIGLAHIEDIRRTKADEYGLILLGDVLLGLAVLLLANPDHRGENADAFLSLDDSALLAGSITAYTSLQRGLTVRLLVVRFRECSQSCSAMETTPLRWRYAVSPSLWPASSCSMSSSRRWRR